MSFFEECLSLGQWLGEDRSRALYKYLLQKKKNIYKNEAEELLRNRIKNTFIANGEIEYFIEMDLLSTDQGKMALMSSLMLLEN